MYNKGHNHWDSRRPVVTADADRHSDLVPHWLAAAQQILDYNIAYSAMVVSEPFGKLAVTIVEAPKVAVALNLDDACILDLSSLADSNSLVRNTDRTRSSVFPWAPHVSMGHAWVAAARTSSSLAIAVYRHRWSVASNIRWYRHIARSVCRSQ